MSKVGRWTDIEQAIARDGAIARLSCRVLRLMWLSYTPPLNSSVMKSRNSWLVVGVLLLLTFLCAPPTCAAQSGRESTNFGPVVTAYLRYLDAEQLVTDDRLSQREISPVYYRRNLNRIRSLRRTAIKIARESGNDYLPEMIAVTRDEFNTLFEEPPALRELEHDRVFNYTFRFIETVRSGETFYLFARLDPYEQAEQRARDKQLENRAASPPTVNDDATHANNTGTIRTKGEPDNNDPPPRAPVAPPRSQTDTP